MLYWGHVIQELSAAGGTHTHRSLLSPTCESGAFWAHSHHTPLEVRFVSKSKSTQQDHGKSVEFTDTFAPELDDLLCAVNGDHRG